MADAQTFTNPILGSGADPWVTQWKGQYFYMGTTGGDVKIARSPYLTSIGANSRQVWNPPIDAPYGQQLWAPELHRINDKWYLYVAADDGVDANHRMYVLEGDSQDPQATYTLKGQISTPADRWGIDGTVFQNGNKNYFIWSGRTNGSIVDSGNAQSLYISEMSNPWTLTGTRTMISTPTYSWEKNGHWVNEGPEILKHGNDVWLTYSASGYYTEQYALGALKLTGSNPLLASAWTKQSQPLFDQGNGVVSTGHASFVKSPDGTQDWLVYHARTSIDAARDVRIQPFAFGSNGVPAFGNPVAAGQSIANPSGVPLVTFIPNMSFERGGTNSLTDFNGFGAFGAVDNRGVSFNTIANGDGPRVGYLGAGLNSGIYQDVGPAHAGLYTLSVDMALSSDQLATAIANDVTFLLRLESVGVNANGTANESLKQILGERAINSATLNALAFTTFDVDGVVSPDLANTWLRVGVYAPNAKTTGSSLWQAKLDNITLDFTTTVPEPALASALLAGGALLTRRRGR